MDPETPGQAGGDLVGLQDGATESVRDLRVLHSVLRVHSHWSRFIEAVL